MSVKEAEYRQEVEDWTRWLRTKAAFGDLRDGLEEKGVDWRTALLAFVGEDEAGDEQGAIVTAAGKIYRFTRERDGTGAWRFAALLDATNDPPLREDFREQIDAALALLAIRDPPR